MNFPGIESLLATDAETKPLYRIVHFDHLAEWFETGSYPLLSPEKWEDPFEKVLKQAVFPDDEHVPYAKGHMYGLCLTRDGTSDALWRVYSPVQYGIRIRTTPQLLAEALSNASELAGGRTYIGEVEYQDGKSLVRHAKMIRDELGRALDTRLIAKTMLMKRRPFSYEREVRVLHLTGTMSVSDPLCFFTANPHKVVQSILIDPRAPDHRFQALRRYFKHVAKYEGPINKSALYQMPSLNGK